jgi:integrase
LVAFSWVLGDSHRGAYYVLASVIAGGKVARLTKRTVDAAKPGERDRFVWDEDQPGFGLKVTPAGRKVFLLQYRLGGRSGRTRRVTIGSLGQLTSDQARADAKRLLRDIGSGIDPAAERTKKKSELTLGAVLDRFLREHVATKLRAKTAEEYERIAKLHVSSRLKGRPVGSIERADIARLHHEMADRPYQANRTIAMLSKVFSWAEKHGLRATSENPCRFIEKYTEAKRERFLSPQELTRLGSSLAASKENPYAIAAVRLLLFTGARLSEILTLRWDAVDLEGGTARLAQSKTGPQTLYLNAPALQVLTTLPRFQGNPFAICGERPNAHLVNLQKPWRAIRLVADLNDVRLHDLRHTFASVGVGGGASLHMVGALLGHSQPQTTDRYAHLAADPLRAASDAIARRIATALNNEPLGTVANR